MDDLQTPILAAKTSDVRPSSLSDAWQSLIPACAVTTAIIPKKGIIIPKLGIKDLIVTSNNGLADALFSGTKRQVLGLLFGQPERSFYTTEVITLVGSGSGSVQRELATLAQSGLLTVKAIGNQKHYQADLSSPIFEELRSIVQKTIGLADPLRTALSPLHSLITASFVYGSIAKRTDTAHSDIDLMLISDTVTYADVFSALEDISNRLGRSVNPTILTRDEFSHRLATGESFLTRVMDQAKVWVLGDASDLPA